MDEESTSNAQRSTSNAQGGMTDGRETARRGQYDLEERLLDFAAGIIRLAGSLPGTRAGNHVAGQLLRCGTSPLPNHGEAQAAESRNDFEHKMGVCLKELRETRRWLRLIARVPLLQNLTMCNAHLAETEELIRIFWTSINTSRQKHRPNKTRPNVGS